MSKNRPDRTQLQKLRALAHRLKPVVRLGQAGLTEAVTHELDAALRRHELVKVKLAAEGKAACEAQALALAQAVDGALVQRIGHTATLYRVNPERARIDTAVAARAGTRGPARAPRRP